MLQTAKKFINTFNVAHPHWRNRFIEQTNDDPAYLRFYTESELKTLLSSLSFEPKIQYNQKRSAIYTICRKILIVMHSQKDFGSSPFFVKF